MLSFRRMFHIYSVAFGNKKLGIQLNKMVNPSKKRKWSPKDLETDIMPSVKSLTKTKNEPGKRATRRSAMLNKLFMKYITDIMSTGTVSMTIVGRGIEISKVQISPDLQTLNVFWVCKGDASDEETEAVLSKSAGALRHELSTLRVMGEIPYIFFVKDQQEARLVDVDRRLKIADYGEDYTPLNMGELIKTEFSLNTKLSTEIKEKIKQLEEEVPIVDDPIPVMTHNIYGFDHDKVMNRLLAARKKSKDAWIKFKDNESLISYRTNSTEKPTSIDINKQKKELAEFLLKRKIKLNNKFKEMRATANNQHLDPDEEYENLPEDDTYYDNYRNDYQEDELDYYTHDFTNKANNNDNVR